MSMTTYVLVEKFEKYCVISFNPGPADPGYTLPVQTV